MRSFAPEKNLPEQVLRDFKDRKALQGCLHSLVDQLCHIVHLTSLKYNITAFVAFRKGSLFNCLGNCLCLHSIWCEKPSFASALIVTFPAAIVVAQWSLHFPVSPGYHFPFKSWHAPTLSQFLPNKNVTKHRDRTCR